MRNFRTLKIWHTGMEIVKQVYLLATVFPKEEQYGLRSQISRAAVSIPSNIAEGCSRSSEIEYKRFLEIALGSLFELDTQLEIVQELDIVQKEDLESLQKLITEEGKMLNGLISKLKANNLKAKG